jgi:tetratricopeptide (TPR) repeat protein
MLETIREFATEQLERDDDPGDLRHSHASYYVALAERAEGELNGPDQVAWTSRLDAEDGNLRAALAWSLDREPQTAARLAAALWRWWVSGRLTEGRSFSTAVIAASGVDAALRAKVLRGAAALARTQGDLSGAESLAQESLALYRRLGDRRGVAGALQTLANVAVDASDLERAESLYQEALPVMRELGYVPGVSSILTNLGVVSRFRGDLDRARAFYEQSLELDGDSGDPKGTAITLLDLGHVALESGDLQAARGSLEQSLRLFHGVGEQVGIASCLDGLARAQATERPERAARLWGARERIVDELGIRPTERDARERADAIAATRRASDPDTFDLAWQDGRALELEDAVRYALGDACEPGRTA